MTEIKLSKESIDFLKDLVYKINTQDNRATSNPRYYCVQEDEIIYGIEDDYTEDYRYISYDGDIECETWEEACNTEFAEDVKKFGQTKWDKDDKEELLEHCGWREIGIRKIHKYSNCFLTEDACEKYIKTNKHNLNNPHSYLMHAYRNYELEQLINVIKEIGESIND